MFSLFWLTFQFPAQVATSINLIIGQQTETEENLYKLCNMNINEGKDSKNFVN